MALRRFIDRITKPVEELDRIAIAEWSEDVEAVPIDRIEMRRPVFVAGEVSSWLKALTRSSSTQRWWACSTRSSPKP